MKRLFLFFLLLVSIHGFAQTVKFSSTPEMGKPVQFEYNPKGGSLEKLSNITCVAKMLIHRDYSGSTKVELKKVGDVYRGEFTPLDSAHLAILIFSTTGTADENPNGYFTKLYQNGKATAMGVFLEGYLHAGFGKNLAKMKTDLPNALALYTSAFTLEPKFKAKYINNYLVTLYAIDPLKGKKEVLQTISQYNSSEPSEWNSLQIPPLYMIINNKVAADSVFALIKAQYPIGAYALSRAVNAFHLVKDLQKKEEKFKEIVREFKLDLAKKEDVARLNWLFPIMGDAFSNIDPEKMEFYYDKFEPKLTRAMLYHKLARKNVEAMVNLEIAERAAKKCLAIIDSLKNEPVPLIYSSKNAYLRDLNETAIPYQLTYVRILSALGREYALTTIEHFVNENGFSDPDLNSSYISLLGKNDRKEEVIKYAERFVKAGQSTAQIRADLKVVYRGTLPFETYFANLEKEARLSYRAKFLEEMVKVPAPPFTLLNLKGEKIDLLSLKGKVVVIDYWATWCSPCIASFPGMQLAVDKYKNDPNVVFLFINTLEKLESSARENVVKNWMLTYAKYTFNVLLDTKSKMDATEYETANKYKVNSIPAKFIIDGAGNIRFIKIGSSDVNETIVKELDEMIALAKEAKN